MGIRERSGGTLLPACTIVAALLIPSVATAAPGDLDPSFGDGGAVTKNMNGGQFASVAIDSRGRIVAAGNSFADGRTPTHFVLARYRSNGRLDPSFGDGGVANTDVPGGVSSVAIDRRGRIVAAGCVGYNDFEVARFHSDGTPDDSFGHGGVVTTDSVGHCALSVGIDSRGRIAVVGNSGGRRHGYGGWFVLARYTSRGALDDSFSGDGKAITGFRSYPTSAFGVQATSAVIDPRDRIVAAGSIISSDYPYDRDFALVRFSANGIPTTRSFGVGGEVTTDIGAEDRVNSIAIDPQGRLVAAGLTYTTVPYVDSFALARYTPDGSLDPSFGGDGRVAPGGGTIADVAIDSRGRIVAVGYPRCGDQCSPNFVVARFNPDGSRDRTFGGDGRVVTDFGPPSRPETLAIDSVDRIVVAGSEGAAALLARYLGG